MSADLPKPPHFTVVLDDLMGDTATVVEADDGEVYCLMHPSAAETDSPARYNGHVAFSKAVELALQRFREGNNPDSAN